MKAEDNLKVYCFTVIKDATTPVKVIVNSCGVLVFVRALAAAETVGIMRLLSDFLGALKANGCPSRATIHSHKGLMQKHSILTVTTTAIANNGRKRISKNL